MANRWVATPWLKKCQQFYYPKMRCFSQFIHEDMKPRKNMQYSFLEKLEKRLYFAIILTKLDALVYQVTAFC